MLVFPSAKINLGLAVTEKRADGFHNIETAFYPVSWCDALEVILSDTRSPFELSTSGLNITGNQKDNLLYKVYEQVSAIKKLPNIKVHLHKHIPMGAGLGGGSSDAAFFINLLDKKFELGLNTEIKHSIATKIGSDCAFFLENNPVFAHGKGDLFKPLNADLSKYYILIVFPDIHSNTKEAYEGLTPKKNEVNLKEIIETQPLKDWKNSLFNDFEPGIFKKYPAVKDLKEQLYKLGALYASMSGSGSSVFGIFENKPVVQFPKEFLYHLQVPKS